MKIYRGILATETPIEYTDWNDVKIKEIVDVDSMNIDRIKENGIGSVLFNHSRSEPIGKIIDLYKENKQVIILYSLYEGKDDVNSNKIKEGLCKGLSVGLKLDLESAEWSEEVRDEEGYIISATVRHKNSEVIEASRVWNPADKNCYNISIIENEEKND